VTCLTDVVFTWLYAADMAHTLVVNLLHCVFSTKSRTNFISEPEKLWNYIRGVGHNIGVNVLAVGGTSNHVHALISVPPTKLVAHVIRDLKANSSRHLNETSRFAWQDGYAAISVSPSMIGKVREYITSQVEHHQRVTFEVEYRSLMDKAGMEYDPEFLFG
jgi:REP element-mobilizing transposase RayT